MHIASIAAIAVLISSPCVAQPFRISSAYTSLDLDRCERLDQGKEPGSARWRCTGFAGISLYVQNGDDRYDVDAGREDKDELWSDSFDYPGKTVEWRLARGKPFAIIYRLESADQDGRKGSHLMVETVGRASPGCRIAAINARTRGANEQARRAADQISNGRVRCLKH